MANEKRLIDANALLAKFERIAKKSGVPHFHLDEIADEINEADAVEVVHGRWLESEGTVCSVCNKHFFTDGPWAVANYKANYCPNCGARMDGGVEDGC